jgi:protease-4
MKNFFKTFLASALGTIFAFVLLSFISVISMLLIVFFTSTGFKKTTEDSPILKIDLSGLIMERELYNPLSLVFPSFGIKSQGLNNILAAIKNAKTDSKIKGIYLNAGIAQTGIAAMREIREALLDFKESGKFIVAYGEIISQRSYYVASIADKIILNPLGMLELKGLGGMQQYNKNVFEKMGIEMQVFKVGTYKSYVESFISDKMSEEDKMQRGIYLSTLWKEILGGISESRKISADSLNRYADEYLLFSAPETLVKYGLVDSLSYKVDFESSLKKMAGIAKDKELKFQKVSDMLNDASFSTDKIAILYAEGDIVSDAEEDIYSNPAITAKTYIKELKNLQKDSSVKAVVFRVNSSGGSAYASDQIWHSIRELSVEKPVIASFGSYAASGGYYIACGASKIVSSPATLTGSIGIFGLFPSGEKLAKKIGASYDGIGTNKNTLLGEQILTIPFLGMGILPARPLNKGEHAMLQAYVERGYDAFLARCAEGRKMSKAALDSIGQGRVWAGEQAVNIGLADTLGGIETAVKLAAAMADLEDYSIEEYPKMKDPIERFFEEAFKYAKVRSLEFIFGKDGYEASKLLKALENYDYRQAIMPAM